MARTPPAQGLTGFSSRRELAQRHFSALDTFPDERTRVVGRPPEELFFIFIGGVLYPHLPLPFWERALAAAVFSALVEPGLRKTLLAAVAALLLVWRLFLAIVIVLRVDPRKGWAGALSRAIAAPNPGPTQRISAASGGYGWSA